jgi:hypothetical protein
LVVSPYDNSKFNPIKNKTVTGLTVTLPLVYNTGLHKKIGITSVILCPTYRHQYHVNTSYGFTCNYTVSVFLPAKPTTLIGAPNQPPTQTSGTISQPTSPTLSELLSALEQFNKPNSTVLNETNPQPNSEGQLPHKPILLQNITTLGDLIRTMSDLNLTNFDELRQLASPSDAQLLNRLFDVTDGLNVTTIDGLIALTTRLGIYFENSTGIEDIIGSLELINTGASASNVTGNPVAGDNTNISETMTTTDEYSRMETVSNGKCWLHYN